MSYFTISFDSSFHNGFINSVKLDETYAISHHDHSEDMTTRIEDVLAPRNPSLTDENDWEEFALTDVKVRIPGKSRYANLLSASEDSPVTVTGQLEIIEESQNHLLRDENYRSKRVVLENVIHYAYGQHDDGELGIWVAGPAGWFSIGPSKGYKPMFNEIIEAVDLLYFLADKHQNKGRKRTRWQPKVDFLFEEYVKHTNGACEDAEAAAEIFDKHHIFLITQMVRGKEGVDWQETPLYHHFRDIFPDEFEQVEATVRSTADEEPEDAMDEDAPGTNQDEDEGEDGDGDENEDENDDDEQAQAETIFDIVLDWKETGQLSKRRLNIRNLAAALLERYEMSSLQYAIELITARAEHIIRLMDSDEQESTYYWSRKVIYEELRAAMSIEGAETIGTTPLHPRQLAETPSSSEESEGDPRSRKRGKRRVRKSLLRPKVSSLSAKRTGKRNKRMNMDLTDSEAEEDSEEDDDEVDMEDYIPNDDNTPSKSRRQQLVRNALTTSVINDRIRSLTSHSASPSLDHIKLHDTDKTDPRLEIYSNGDDGCEDEDIPIDTWVCPVLGCSKMISKASSKRGREAITDHSLVHADDTQTKLNLVLAEQRLNVNASVGNLLSKIQSFAGSVDGLGQDHFEDTFGHGTG